MFEDVDVYNSVRKLIVISGERYLCDIILMGQYALCSGEKISTGERIDWVEIDDTLNPAFSFGEYIKENNL